MIVPVTRVFSVVVIILALSWAGGAQAHSGPSQLILASRDIRAREAPELQSGDRGHIWHLIAGSKNRDTGPGARRVKGSVMLEDILPCVVTSDCPVPVWSSAVFRDTRQLSSDRVSLGQAPSQQHGPARAQHWAQSGEHEFSWDRDEMSECNYRGQGPWQLPSLTSGARGASVTRLASVVPSVLWIRCHRTSLITINSLETSPLACESSD